MTDVIDHPQRPQPATAAVANDRADESTRPRVNRHGWRWLAGLIISGTIIWQFIGAWQDSQTTDEAAHLAAGYSYWRTGDFRLNPEHPPLVKLLAAGPLFFINGLNFSTTTVNWQERQQWQIGADLVYASFPDLNGARWIIWLGRIGPILLWGLLAGLIYGWSRQRWGELGGLLSLSLFACDPNFLGHGHAITTDVAVALGYAATIWSLDRLFRQPNWWRLTALVAIFAVSQLTKYSALLLWLIVPSLGLIRLTYQSRPAWSWRWWWRLMAGLVIGTGLITWAAYGGEVIRIDSDPRIDQLWQERQALVDSGQADRGGGLVGWLVRISAPDTVTGRWLSGALDHSIPAYHYWRGLFATWSHNYAGRGAFLLGQTSDTGWWYYFPVAMAVKTPLVTILVLAAAAGLGWRYRRAQSFDWWLLGLPPLLYFLWSLTSHINIGLRHVFPVYPFLFLAAGGLARPWPRWDRWRGWAVATAIVGIAATVAIAYPNTFGYFNALAGGSRGGHRILLDSNLDWNQDFWRLRKFLDEHDFAEVRLALFGSIPSAKFFPVAGPVPTNQHLDDGYRPSGIIAISAGMLYNRDLPFDWLRELKPRWRIGSSVLVFDFR